MFKKRYAAIISEYNPFHYGHLYQIECLKKDYDGIICIMSGNLVQRGEVAVADKYIRAKAALMCGASLVVELPFPFCMLSAKDFASAGVYIAASLGVEALGFGCEDDFSLLTRISDVITDISFEKNLNNLIKFEKNLSFPKAKEKLLESILGAASAEVIRKPNNILTLEYLAAIKKGGYGILPHPVKRDMSLRSSSSIRKEQSREAMLSLLPPESSGVYTELNESKFPRRTDNLSQYIIGTLRNNINYNDFYGTTKDLFNIIMSTAQNASTFSELIEACQNALYTEARVRRSVLSMVFNISTEIALCKPSYTMLLAADSEGCTFLKNRKKQFGIPVITKPSHIKKESNEVKVAFIREAELDNVLALSAPKAESINLMVKTPFILNNIR
ncbi:MAG: hypothetical protein A2Y15_00925 [Clostridiales bacterium GWF2_36_10]|nr:MAG: hypothetical protein A2Y15_00925 [Clostridiales bacterium GWF2_36_10]HAN20578.1 hypothetical protein [Clostridiales bacterium]